MAQKCSILILQHFKNTKITGDDYGWKNNGKNVIFQTPEKSKLLDLEI